MKSFSVLLLVASISFIAGAGLTFVAKTPWPSDMANQPSFKPQELPLLPPEGSVATDQVGGTGEKGSTATQKHNSASAKHDHSVKEKGQTEAHQHSPGGAGGHSHDDPGTKHDHGVKNVAPTKTHTSGPKAGKTSQLQGLQQSGSKSAGAHDHGTQDHGAHDHKAATKGSENKGKSPSAPQQHSHAGAGHDHGGGAGHSQGHEAEQNVLTNPILLTEASVKTGHKLFNIYCAVCHGNEGRGGAPMANKLAGIPKFTGELLKSVDDAHMFTMVTSGHGPMPGYGEALTPVERWHVTNYLRTLQEKLAAEKKVANLRGESR